MLGMYLCSRKGRSVAMHNVRRRVSCMSREQEEAPRAMHRTDFVGCHHGPDTCRPSGFPREVRIDPFGRNKRLKLCKA